MQTVWILKRRKKCYDWPFPHAKVTNLTNTKQNAVHAKSQRKCNAKKSQRLFVLP
jgi:hypothetical protein